MILCRFIYFFVMLLNAIDVTKTRKSFKNNAKSSLAMKGAPANEGDAPYFVSVKEVYTYGHAGVHTWVHICSGCIIGELKFITAAHCFTTKNAETLRAVTGSTYKYIHHKGNTVSTIDSQWRKLAKVTISDYFFFPYHDVAVAFIDDKWKFGYNVNYIPMARMEHQYSKPCLTLGFSKLSNRARPLNESEVLVVTPIKILSKTACPSFVKGVSNKFICTLTENVEQVVYESGSPLVCKQTLLEPVDDPDKGVLVGIMSLKNNDMTLYTRISYVFSWINSVHKLSSEPHSRRSRKNTEESSEKASKVSRLDPRVIGLFMLLTALFFIM